MCVLSTARFISCFLVAVGAISAQTLCCEKGVVYEGKTMRVVVPIRPLAKGAIQIEPREELLHFPQWSDEQIGETYELMQKVVSILDAKGISNYMNYGKSDTSSFHWEVVLYPKKGWKLFKQLKVLWNSTFGAPRLSPKAFHATLAKYKQETKRFSEPLAKLLVSSCQREADPFCNDKVIQKQLLFEGSKIYVLYNYAPVALGKEKLDFLILPKCHRARFSDLTQSEYIEAMHYSQALIRHFNQKGFLTTYLFDKTGDEAGQTVLHWHQHVIFTKSKTEELLGKLKVFKNMLFGSSPLSVEALQERVLHLRVELKDELQEFSPRTLSTSSTLQKEAAA